MRHVRHVVFLSALVLLAIIFTWPRSTPTADTSGPMLQEAYVWQRDWNEHVRESVRTHADSFQKLIVLHGEISWDPNRPPLAHVALDIETLRTTSSEIGLSLRIGNFGGPFHENDERAQWLVGICRSMLAEAAHHEVTVAELHIDFDCAESKLAGYQHWLKAIREAISPTPLSITALPSWLDQSAFGTLIQHVDSYVLQVHSITPPASPGQSISLCHPEAAKKAVKRAGRFAVPFRVALPTYGYLMAFDEKGAFVGISAETMPRDWTHLPVVEEAWPDPNEVSGLIQTWQQQRPAAMQGVIWFRLPVAGDRMNWPWATLRTVMEGRSPTMNWPWATLRTVMEGRSPTSNLQCVQQMSDDGLTELFLENQGETLESFPKTVILSWKTAQLLSGDGVHGYTLHRINPTQVQLKLENATRSQRLKPQARTPIGWLRFHQMPRLNIEFPVP